jgi:hypothetical protein
MLFSEKRRKAILQHFGSLFAHSDTNGVRRPHYSLGGTRVLKAIEESDDGGQLHV